AVFAGVDCLVGRAAAVGGVAGPAGHGRAAGHCSGAPAADAHAAAGQPTGGAAGRAGRRPRRRLHHGRLPRYAPGATTTADRGSPLDSRRPDQPNGYHTGGPRGGDRDLQAHAGVDLPGGGWVSHDTANAVTAAAGLLWLRRRRRYRPGPLRASGRRDTDLTELPDTVAAIVDAVEGRDLHDPDAAPGGDVAPDVDAVTDRDALADVDAAVTEGESG